MSELNFNDLPAEMLIKVFRLLDAENLKNATLTCKLWKSLIEAACRWSLKLMMEYGEENLFFRYGAEQKMNFILATNRKFETIRMDCLCENSQILAIFRKHGFYVVELYLSYGYIDAVILFAKLLRFTPNLKFVDIQSMMLHDSSDVPDHVLPDLKKLTNLELYVNDFSIIQCFRKAKLTTMITCEDGDSRQRSALASFVLSQEMLTSLVAESYALLPSLLPEMGKLNVPIPFRLTRLAISHMGSRNSPQDHNLLKFVKSQASSLTEMEIGEEIPSSVYECVFASMTNLNSLGVTIDDVPRDNEFYERLQENGNVCTVKILDIDPESSCDMQYFSKFLKKLPNIRNLFLSRTGCSHKNILAVAAQHLRKIEFLYMRFFHGHFIRDIGCVNFPNLKTLHIGLLRVRIDWNEFTKIHSRLTELIIEEIDKKSFLTNDDIDQITTNVDLQNLKLGVGFVADNRFFEIIRIKCPNFKVFDLHKSCVPLEINCYKENNLLRLCEVLECSKYSQMLYDPYE